MRPKEVNREQPTENRGATARPGQTHAGRVGKHSHGRGQARMCPGGAIGPGEWQEGSLEVGPPV